MPFPHRRDVPCYSLQRRILSLSLSHARVPITATSFLPHPYALQIRKNINNRDPGRIENIKDDAHGNTSFFQNRGPTHTHTHITHGRGKHTTTNPPRILLSSKLALTTLSFLSHTLLLAYSSPSHSRAANSTCALSHTWARNKAPAKRRRAPANDRNSRS
jgi:hypothetical protein